MYLARDLRHIVDAAGNVREMAETDEPGPRIEQLFQLRHFKFCGLGIEAPFANCKAELLKPPPGSVIGLMV